MLSGGNRIPQGLDRFRAANAPSRASAQDRLWGIPARPGKSGARAMKVIQTALPGAVVIEPQVFGDARGFFYESFNAARYGGAGINACFVQSNVSRSANG